MILLCRASNFNPRAPCGARRSCAWRRKTRLWISTHAPLAGRDYILPDASQPYRISTHAPLAGRDAENQFTFYTNIISTHAPLAGRDIVWYRSNTKQEEFQPTRPLRGATLRNTPVVIEFKFQPTRPLRGATLAAFQARRRHSISTHAPLAGRDVPPSVTSIGIPIFQPTRPLRGATSPAGRRLCPWRYFNPRAPCGARHHLDG